MTIRNLTSLVFIGFILFVNQSFAFSSKGKCNNIFVDVAVFPYQTEKFLELYPYRQEVLRSDQVMSNDEEANHVRVRLANGGDGSYVTPTKSNFNAISIDQAIGGEDISMRSGPQSGPYRSGYIIVSRSKPLSEEYLLEVILWVAKKGEKSLIPVVLRHNELITLKDLKRIGIDALIQIPILKELVESIERSGYKIFAVEKLDTIDWVRNYKANHLSELKNTNRDDIIKLLTDIGLPFRL